MNVPVSDVNVTNNFDLALTTNDFVELVSMTPEKSIIFVLMESFTNAHDLHHNHESKVYGIIRTFEWRSDFDFLFM